MKKMKVGACPTIQLGTTNSAFVYPQDFDESIKRVKIPVADGYAGVLPITRRKTVPMGTIWLSIQQRTWLELEVDECVEVVPYNEETYQPLLTTIKLQARFLQTKRTLAPYDCDTMASEFLSQFQGQVLTLGQRILFDMKLKEYHPLVLEVMDLEGKDTLGVVGDDGVFPVRKTSTGVCFDKTMIIFNKLPASVLNLVSSMDSKHQGGSILKTGWSFQETGVGGLSYQINTVLRRALQSRNVPSELIAKLGYKHTKGILLHGPPGTGKTHFARQIGKMTNSREPKIVNGSEIFSKWVGESGANIRKLFAEAEEEEKREGINSALHIIIFDEIDAICKKRGSVAGDAGVGDDVLTQLLTKMDGVEQSNNVLIVGMTNRIDVIDEALLRPGRFEVKIEFGLPNESDRAQILEIHTAALKENNCLSTDVVLSELVTLTDNFTGAEIERLVRAAMEEAFKRLPPVQRKQMIVSNVKVYRKDFIHALEFVVKPAFGKSDGAIESFIPRGIIPWGAPIENIFDDGVIFTKQCLDQSGFGLVTVLLEGPNEAGKTALAAKLAKLTGFRFVRVCSPENLVGKSESQKLAQICKYFDDAYRSKQSCLVVDSIEQLVGFSFKYQQYSNDALQTLRSLLTKEPPKGHKLLIICTTSIRDILDKLKILPRFTQVIQVPNLSTFDHLKAVLVETGAFSESQIDQLAQKVGSRRLNIGIKTVMREIDLMKKIDEECRVEEFLSKLESKGLLGKEPESLWNKILGLSLK